MTRIRSPSTFQAVLPCHRKKMNSIDEIEHEQFENFRWSLIKPHILNKIGFKLKFPYRRFVKRIRINLKTARFQTSL